MEEKEISLAEPEAEQSPAPEAESAQDEVDYAAVLGADIEELKATFPELGGMKNIDELADPVRFGALRDLGLTAKEAYLASGGKKRSYDNRTHLVSSVPGGARSAADGHIGNGFKTNNLRTGNRNGSRTDFLCAEHHGSAIGRNAVAGVSKQNGSPTATVSTGYIFQYRRIIIQ